MARALATPLGRGRLRALRRGAALLQPATTTWMDRHPPLFALVGARMAGRHVPRLLSFGCATGEEALTLAHRCPDARIDAIDANPACISRARRAAEKRGGGRIRFACADTPDAFAPDLYDAILCLSVLRHGALDRERPASSATLLPFARFAEMIAALDDRLLPGGLLIVWGSNFRFADTATARRYRAIAVPGMAPQPGPFYGADDGLLPDAATTAFAFVKAD